MRGKDKNNQPVWALEEHESSTIGKHANLRAIGESMGKYENTQTTL